jgi:NAD(P)H-nitrite reductase large subunit
VPHQYAIVGSGIAGLSAAESLRQLDPRAAITMVSEEPHDFYSRPGLAYLLRGDFPEKQLFVRSRDDLHALNLTRVHGRVARLLCDEHELLLEDGRRVAYDRVLLATGSLAVPPPFPGGDLLGVVKLDSLDDTRHILRLAVRGKPAVVVGGGITALELAEGLAARGMEVHYFLRGARYWADVLDEAESHIVHERLAHEGVTVHTETQIKQAIGKAGRLAAVETQAGATVPCQVLGVAIGVKPRLDLARAAGLTVDRGVVVNELLQTSSPDVFAAGDIAQSPDPRGAILDVLWSTALAQGRAAGANMAGAGRPYVKGVAFNVTMLTRLKVTIIGTVGGKSKEGGATAIARGDSEEWRLAPRSWVSAGEDVNRVRLALDDRRIVGALVMGDQAWSRPLQRLIVGQADVTPIRPALLSGGAGALEQLALFHEQWQRARERV